MSATSASKPPVARLSVWLAGQIDFENYLRVADRLAFEVAEPDGRGPTLLLCEHADVITMGRLGSRRDVEFTDEELKQQGIRLRFVGRGGGAVLHTPGQLAVYLFARLTDLGLGEHDVAAYVDRFEGGLAAAVGAMKCPAERVSGVPGVFGASGQLAAVGIAVRRGVVTHGGFVNVSPPSALHRRVRTTSRGSMGSIEADRRRRAAPAEARSVIVQQIAAAFNAEVVSLQSGIPGGLAGSRPLPPQRARRHVG
jgi:lipoyl(octanoyl) transferase